MAKEASQPPPTADSPEGMSQVVHRNIRSILALRRQEDARRSLSNRVADGITVFAGSMWCVYVHALWFGAWILVNCRVFPGIRPFDPYPFVMLAMTASVEAIFLSTFILITQNRMQRIADHRAELDLQISLLAEHELTGVVRLLDQIARRLDISPESVQGIEEAKKDIDATRVSEAILRAESDADRESSAGRY